jgi:hypothetical protein
MNAQYPSGFATLARSAVFAATGILLAASPAMADDNYVAAAVAATPASVTYSTAAQPNFGAFNVTLAHGPEEDRLTSVQFKASTVVVDAAGAPMAGQIAAFDAASLPAGCTIDTAAAATLTSVTCTFTTGVTVRGGVVNFDLTVAAPLAGASVVLTSRAYWFEGNDRGQSPLATATTALTAPDPTKVSAYVRANFPAKLFTGVNGGIATADDSWTTTVAVPAQSTSTTVNVSEAIDVPLASNLSNKSSSTLAIPGTFPGHLVITLRRDASTIGKGANIATAQVRYFNPAHPAAGIAYPLSVPNCTDTSYGALPQSGIPCISKRTAYPVPKKDDDKKKSSVPAAPLTGYEGDWEFEIQALDNGTYEN